VGARRWGPPITLWRALPAAAWLLAAACARDSGGAEGESSGAVAASPIVSTSARNDDTTVTYGVTYTGTHTFLRVYIDADQSATTGLAVGGVWAEFLIENGTLYRYTGNGSSWSWSPLKSVTFSNSGGVASWQVLRSDLGETAPCTEQADLVFDVDDNHAPKLTQIYTPSASCTSASPISSPAVSNDPTTVSYQFSYAGAPSFFRVYIDVDVDPTTGFAAAPGVGAEFLLENGFLYRHSGAGWSWASLGAATFSAAGQVARWTIARAPIGETAPCGERSTLAFQTQDSAIHTSAAFAQAFADAASCGGGGTGGSGGGGSGGPAVTAVTFGSPDVNGAVAVRATVGGGRGGTLRVAAAVARAGGAFAGASTGGQTVDAGGVVTIDWHPLDDIGFRPDATVVVQLTASDGAGAGPPATFAVPAFANRHAAARRVEHHLINYGTWSAAAIATAQKYDLVIAHPVGGMLVRSTIAALQQGVAAGDPRDDPLVICYVSVGEDLRTGSLSNAQIRADARFRGDGSGPRIDPRGVAGDGASLAGIDPRGLPSNGGTGFASYYLDDNDVHNNASHVGDGFPDRNAIFGALFVNAGDPGWFPVIDAMLIDSGDRVSGLREVLTPGYGRGLDCDGVFLDTIDTAAPNFFTDASSPNESKFEWTAPGFGNFIRHIQATYPDRVILQNRGLFFFDPRQRQYPFNARGAVDFLLFESFRLNSNPTDDIDPVFYPDNRYNYAPKLMAEANRPDGFRLLSLGYAEGPSNQMSHLTLLGQSTLGFDSLIEDIRVTEELQGFRHYLTDGAVTLVNDFVFLHRNAGDTVAPVWTSTFNDHAVTPAQAPTPRVGIQQAVGGGGRITVRWDVALDKNRVSYVLYAQPTPFNFSAAAPFAGSRRIPLTPTVPAAYLAGVGPQSFPYEATITDLPPGQPEFLVIHAVDGASPPNEEGNGVVLTATP
jgi:hypothetical protein